MNQIAPASFLTSYLSPLMPVLGNDAVVELAINPDGRVWVERHGSSHMSEVENLRFDDVAAKDLASAIASNVDVPMSPDKPIVSGKIMVEGAPLRVQVVSSPVVEGCPSITFRRYSSKRLRLADIRLLRDGLVDLDLEKRERATKARKLAENGDVQGAMTLCIEDRLNIVISGGTSSGKTTFARALLDLVNPLERIVTIEDAFELFPSQANSVSMKADRSGGKTTQSASKLLQSSLRMRPDRIIVGELRGEEAVTFLEAINTGHGGSLTTIHADTSKKAIDRLAMLVLGAGINMGFEDVRRSCAHSIDAVIQLGRENGNRGIAEVYIPD